MADEVIKTIENVDKLFSQIVVNGEVHNSERYTQAQEPAPARSSRSRSIQGEDVYGVELNATLHNFVDRAVTQGLTEEAGARAQADLTLQQEINANSNAIVIVQASVTDIRALIPNQASEQNQLVDKNFVNSSIATNTANFLGTYTSLSDIQAIQNPTNNDYAFLQTTDSVGNRQYDRYKYSSSDNQWHYEYTLNNSSFTAEQWATINSGLTQSSVNQAIATACAYCASSNTTVTGASLYTGATLKVLFTAQIAGADTSSALTITYNSSSYTVKVAKDGSLVDFVAKASGNDFVYCQAYTTLELMFDGTNFIIIGNPVVISNSDYTIYADGSKTYLDKDFQALTLTANTFSGGGAYYTKRGNYIYLLLDRLVTKSAVAVSGSVIVGTLPANFRPSTDYRDTSNGIVMGTNSAKRQKYTVTISKEGVITLYNDYGNLNNTIFYASGLVVFPISFS